MSNFSKLAVHRAMNSEDKERLMSLAQEHVHLVKEITVNWGPGVGGMQRAVYDESKMIYEEKIKQIREERDAIIQKYV